MTKSEIKIFLQIDKQGTSYDVNAIYKKENCTEQKKFSKKLYLDTVGSSDNLSVKGYRCYGHKLNSFFQQNIKSIKEGNFENGSDSQISLRTSSDDLKDVVVELKVEICNFKINLYDKDSTLLTNLFYSYEEYSQNRNLYVYFYNPSDSVTDTIPLLFQYKDTFYAPESNEKYFESWREVKDLENVVSSQVNVQLTTENERLRSTRQQKIEKIENKLKEMFEMINQVNLNKKSDYGIPYCKKEFFNSCDFNTKRYKIKISKNNQYQQVTHSSVNKYSIGKINNIENFNFEEHTKKIKTTDVINEVVVYFRHKDNNPYLILLNEISKFSGSITHGYYQKDDQKYKYEHLKEPIYTDYLDEPLFSGESSPIIETLKNINIESMTEENVEQLDTDITKCLGKNDVDSDYGQCSVENRTTHSNNLSHRTVSQGDIQRGRNYDHQDRGVKVANLSIHQLDQGGNTRHLNGIRSQKQNQISTNNEREGFTQYFQIQENSPVQKVQNGKNYEESLMKDIPLESSESDSIVQKGRFSDSRYQNEDSEQSYGHNKDGQEERIGVLPEIPCTGGEGRPTEYVNTGMKGFDNFMNNTINYVKNNAGVVTGAGAGSILSCAGGGYGIYKLFLHFR